MATERQRNRCRDLVGDLAASRLDSESLRYEAVALLRRTVGFDRWCWPLADPDTLVPLSGLAEHDYGPSLPRVLELEYSGADFAAMDAVALRPTAAGTLNVETAGDLARSPRWDEVLRPLGIRDEVVLACRDGAGCWGWLKAYRDGSEHPFSDGDVDLLTHLARGLGSALRQALGRERRPASVAGGEAGVVVLDDHLRPLSATAAARRWIDGLPAARAYAAFRMLPAMVYPVATLARHRRDGARALERAVDGRWVMIEAAPLEGADDGAIAVTFRNATPDETFDRVARIHALTRRERDVVVAVLAGLDSNGVARRLGISRHTVQDHLKAVFAKVGVRTRGELGAAFGPPSPAA